MVKKEKEEIKTEEESLVEVKEIKEIDREFSKKALRLAIENNKIKRDIRDIDIKTKEAEIELNYPNIAVEDTIRELEDLILRKKVKLENNDEIDANPSDVIYMQLRLQAEKDKLPKDIPLRQAKLKLNDMKLSLDSPDSYEKVIKDLEKKITEIERNHQPSETPGWIA